MQDPVTSKSFERVLTGEEKASLRGELFVDRELIGMDFSGADFRDALFEKTRLVQCSLAGADLRGASFKLCDLSAVDLAEAIFGDNRFDGTTFVDAMGLSASTRAMIEQGGGTFQPIHASHR